MKLKDLLPVIMVDCEVYLYDKDVLRQSSYRTMDSIEEAILLVYWNRFLEYDLEYNGFEINKNDILESEVKAIYIERRSHEEEVLLIFVALEGR